MNGVLLYLFAYLFTNLGAFMRVIAFEQATGSNEIIRLRRPDASARPWLAGDLLMFLLSLAGIPATGGFIGKFFVFGAAIQSAVLLPGDRRHRQQRHRRLLLPERRALHVLRAAGKKLRVGSADPVRIVGCWRSVW